MVNVEIPKDIATDRGVKRFRRSTNQKSEEYIIKNKYGGDNEWWNIHPAAKPQEHQRLIHGKDSPARYLFK